MTMTAEKARENVANFNKREEEERTKRAKAYVEDVCGMIEKESNCGKYAIIIKEMEYVADQIIAEKILKNELGFKVNTIPGRECIKISW